MSEWSSHRRYVRKGERGQAAVLAVIGLLILAIGMYTSYNLSRTVYEKIRLQTTADAAAYSLANLEARTFNFIAFSNRAQVANYVQMMEAQSILSSATYLEGTMGYFGDVFQSVGNSLIILGWALVWVPEAGAALRETGEALKELGEALEETYDLMELEVDVMEEWTPRYIQLQTSRNLALFGVASLLTVTTAATVGDGAGAIIRENDPKARRTWLTYALNVLNAASYLTAIDFNGVNFSASGESSKDAKRLMAEMVNASRFGSQRSLPPSFLVSRYAVDLLGGVLLDSVGDLEEAEGNIPGSNGLGGIVRTLLGWLTQPKAIGTTKLLAASGAKIADLDDTANSAPQKSFLSTGEVLAAKDLTLLWGGSEFASVRSSADEGRHCRYKKPSNYGSALRIFTLIFGSASAKGFKCHSENDEGGNHRWTGLFGVHPGGIQPYLKFNPKVSGLGAERTSFNQPDVWIFLNKSAESMGLPGDKDLDFELKVGRQSAELDARIGEDGVFSTGLGKGINVLSRAQVYYHRPGAWTEPPNFFNPYWGARLAPKNAAITRLFNEIGVSGVWDNLIADNIWMH